MPRPPFEENRLCKLLGTELPLIQAGMVWNSGWRLAAAVSQAGALGTIGAGSMSPELLDEHITKLKAATSKPFAVNLPLLYKRIEEQIAVMERHGVPVVITSAGNPKTWAERLKASGAKLLHVVPSARFALKAQAAGCDGVIAEGFEAGGHNGADETTTLVLIPQVVQAVRVPVVAAGGIATGAAWLAAQALGAAGVQVGSRYAITQESSSHAAFKQLVVDAGEGATQLSMKSVVPVRLLKNAFYKQVAAAEAQGASPEELRALLGKGRAKLGMLEGQLDEGELEIGQVASLIDDIPPAGALTERLYQEYLAARAQLLGS